MGEQLMDLAEDEGDNSISTAITNNTTAKQTTISTVYNVLSFPGKVTVTTTDIHVS